MYMSERNIEFRDLNQKHITLTGNEFESEYNGEKSIVFVGDVYNENQEYIGQLNYKKTLLKTAFILWLKIHSQFQNQGYAKLVYLELAKKLESEGCQLVSGMLKSPYTRKIWENFVSEGLATYGMKQKEVLGSENSEFVFKSNLGK